jgi:hypothetical protein
MPNDLESDEPLWLYNQTSKDVVLGAFNVFGTLNIIGVGRWFSLDSGFFLREVSFWMVAEESMQVPPLAPA